MELSDEKVREILFPSGNGGNGEGTRVAIEEPRSGEVFRPALLLAALRYSRPLLSDEISAHIVRLSHQILQGARCQSARRGCI